MKCQYCKRQEDHTHMFIIHDGVKLEDEDFDLKDGKLYHEDFCIGERDPWAGYWIYSKYEKDYQLVYERILTWKTKLKNFFYDIRSKVNSFIYWIPSRIYCTHIIVCSDCGKASMLEDCHLLTLSATCRNCASTVTRKGNKKWIRLDLKFKPIK